MDYDVLTMQHDLLERLALHLNFLEVLLEELEVATFACSDLQYRQVFIVSVVCDICEDWV